MKNFNEQYKFISYLLETPKKTWQSKQISEGIVNNIFISYNLSVVSQEALFLKAVQLIDEPDEKKRVALITIAEQILHVLNIFYSCARRMPSDPKVI